MSTNELRSPNMCSVVYRTINCLTNDNLINIVNPKIDKMLPLVPRVESLMKQVEILSSQLTAKFDQLPKDFRNPDMTEYSQQLKRTAEAAIVTASTTIASQSTIVGGKDGQQSSSSSSGELSEDLRKRKVEEWIAHLTVSHGERGQEYDTVSELTPDDSVSNIGLNTNKQSQQIDEARISGRSSGDGRNPGTPRNLNTGRKNSTENLFEGRFTCSIHNEELPSSCETFSRSSKNEYSSDSASENTLTEYRADKVDTSYDEKSAEELLAVLGINSEAEEWDVDDLLLDLAKMYTGQAVKNSPNIVGTLLYLLKKGAGANVNALDAESKTPLHYPSETGNTAVVELLIERNADFNIEDRLGWTALHIAASKGRTLVVELLLRNGVDIEQKTDGYRYSALALAASAGRTSIVKCLLKAGASFDVRDVDGYTPLHAASLEGHVGIVETLVKAGASIDVGDNVSRTPLIWASRNDHVWVVDILLKAGTSIDAEDTKRFTPLICASYEGHIGVVERLLKAGASINTGDTQGRTPLIWAAHMGHVEVVKRLLKAGASIEAGDNDGWTPLLSASCMGHDGVVKTLLRAGAALDLKTEDGRTALMRSAYWGHKQTTELLLAAGADIRARDKNGDTVLHSALDKHSRGCDQEFACAFCVGFETRRDMVKLLCKKGADPSAKNCRRESPLSLVYDERDYFKSEQKVLINLLKRFGAE